MLLLAAVALAGPLAPSLSLSPSRAQACAPAPPRGYQVTTEREDALIVWDEKQHVEHFIRSARFETSAGSFGFLVPTPTKPTLAAADDGLFEALGQLTAPAIERRAVFDPMPVGLTMLPFIFLIRGAAPTRMVTSAAPVRVLEEVRVGDLDAVVLEADDASALGAWLGRHGFEQRAALVSWLRPYVDQHWKITAFRYGRAGTPATARPRLRPCVCPTGVTCECPALPDDPPVVPAPGASLVSRTVRLSFAADQPIYPYREPADTKVVPARELRLFIVGAANGGRAAGSFVEPDPTLGAWPATLRFSAPAHSSGELAGLLPGLTLPSTFWLSELLDRSSLRPASDLSFSTSAPGGEIHPPPEIVWEHHPVPLPYELPVVAAGLWYWRRRRRRPGSRL